MSRSNLPSLNAISISRRLHRPGRPTLLSGTVLGVYARACHLLTEDGGIVALVWGGIGNGPLNVVLAQPPALPPPGSPERVIVSLERASLWEPRPRWEAVLRPAARRIRRRARLLAPLLNGHETGVDPEAADAVCHAWRGDPAWEGWKRLWLPMLRLVGRGPGLTPAGDDWLAGWLLGVRLHREPNRVVYFARTPGGHCAPPATPPLREIVDAAAQRTTSLSRALLMAAANGEADEAWHSLLAALAQEAYTPSIALDAASRILSHGATSGAAMLAGFLAALDGEPTHV